MKVTLLLYKPGNHLFEIPVYFATDIPETSNTPPFHINNLYKTVLRLFRENPPENFRGRYVAFRPFSMKYSAGTEGGLVMWETSLPRENNFCGLPTPQKIHGDYHIIMMAHYKFCIH